MIPKPNIGRIFIKRLFSAQIRGRAEKFQYMTAIVRDHTSTFQNDSIRKYNGCSEQINLNKAKQQKSVFNHILRDVLGLQLIVLPAREKYPDGVFVQDTAVIIGDEVLITNPGHDNRKGEIFDVHHALINLGLKPTHMQEIDPSATMDGGDVVYTGKEIFVGKSTRTNKEGIRVLSDLFSHYPVTPIEITNELHLSSILSYAGNNKIVYSTSSHGSKWAAQQISQKARYKYDFIGAGGGDVSGANCIYLDAPNTGKTIVHPSKEAFPQTINTWNSITGIHKEAVSMTEIAKADGALTCCTLLLCI